MRTVFFILLTLLIISCKTVETLPQGQQPELKRVSLDTFMNNGLSKSIPLSFLIPSEYNQVDIKAPLTYSYWMPSNKKSMVMQKKGMPTDTGWMYGKITLSIGYDIKSDTFIGRDLFETQAEAAGFTNVVVERIDAGGYPILNVETTHEASGKQLYALYIGMKQETNTIYLAYRQPKGESVVGRYVWENLKKSLQPINP